MSYALLTDLYELTMMQGYVLTGRNPDVVFDMFYRRQPFNGGYAVFAGLGSLLEHLENYRFAEDDLSFLADTGQFRPEFLDVLRDFHFTGDVWAMDEGTICFPNEPLLRIHGSLASIQLIETLVLNIINYQTLVATKTARVVTAAGSGPVLEFGLRRAPGPDGGVSASRAAWIGGAAGTSNTLAAKRYGIPAMGTMAHSWIMAFPDEASAFRQYAELYPGDPTLLIDTYDTLGSGIDAAITVGKELAKVGRSIGVRLDSGDLAYLSQQVRRRMDDAGLTDARIIVSNELTEEIVSQLKTEGAPIDAWGVGTNLVTGGTDSSLTGVYKLAAKRNGGDWEPTLKVSNNPEKTTNPGIKQVYRFIDDAGQPLADLVALEQEVVEPGRTWRFYHPTVEYGHFDLSRYHQIEPLLRLQMVGGKRVDLPEPLQKVRDRVSRGLSGLHPTHKRIINPHSYKVSLSRELRELKFQLVQRYLSPA